MAILDEKAVIRKKDGRMVPILHQDSNVNAAKIVFSDGKTLQEKIANGEIGSNIKIGNINTTINPDGNANVDISVGNDGDLDFNFVIPQGPPGENGDDAYHVQIISSNGLTFKHSTASTTLYAYVYKGIKDITGELNATQFRWYRTSDDPESDMFWNQTHNYGAKSIVITQDDVKSRATFNCEVSIDDVVDPTDPEDNIVIDASVKISSDQWIYSNGIYIASIERSVHQQGLNARVVNAETVNENGNYTEAIVSYQRSNDGDILVYSNSNTDCTIFIRKETNKPNNNGEIITCRTSDWVLSGDYYTFEISNESDTRIIGAESQNSEVSISYVKSDDTIVIYSNIAFDGQIFIAKDQSQEDLPIGSYDKAITCFANEWEESEEGYYVLTLDPGIHEQGNEARIVCAEKQDENDYITDVVISYERFPDGNLRVYSSSAFNGKIYVRG